jgi:uncharacterized protein YqeY
MALRDELTARLRTAIKERDRPVAAALRTALGAISNAEAIPVEARSNTSTATSAHVAGTVAGLGAAEALRRELHEDDLRAIVEQQRAELVDHAGRLAHACRLDEADSARRAATVLCEVLSIPSK